VASIFEFRNFQFSIFYILNTQCCSYLTVFSIKQIIPVDYIVLIHVRTEKSEYVGYCITPVKLNWEKGASVVDTVRDCASCNTVRYRTGTMLVLTVCDADLNVAKSVQRHTWYLISTSKFPTDSIRVKPSTIWNGSSFRRGPRWKEILLSTHSFGTLVFVTTTCSIPPTMKFSLACALALSYASRSADAFPTMVRNININLDSTALGPVFASHS